MVLTQHYTKHALFTQLITVATARYRPPFHYDDNDGDLHESGDKRGELDGGEQGVESMEVSKKGLTQCSSVWFKYLTC